MNYKTLILLATLGITAQIAAGYYDEEGNYHHTGLFHRRERVAARRGFYEDGTYHPGNPHHTAVGQAASDTAHGAGEVASTVFHDIF